MVSSIVIENLLPPCS